ncbi:MAG: hypothetical protein MI864_25005 [Pseudomonadales bacterium]|nr:hypothetical protein [Pseudomonadales bacterium]
MKWKIVFCLVSFTIVYFFFGAYGTGKVSTVQSAVQLNDHAQEVLIPSFYPTTESLGNSHDNHVEFIKREHPELTTRAQKIQSVDDMQLGEEDTVDIPGFRVDDIYNSIAEIYSVAVEGDVDAIQTLTVLGVVNPDIIPDWIDPYDLIIQHDLKDSDSYLYALISKSHLEKAFSVAEEKYRNGDFDAGMHLALFLYHDARFLKDQNPIHFSTWGIPQDVHRASRLLIDMCAKQHRPACDLVAEKI